MFQRRIFHILVSLAFVFIVIACSKKEDPPPNIIISSPVALQTFNAGDSIPVKASISHTSPILSVKVSLLDENSIVAQAPSYFFPATSYYDLDILYPLEGKLQTATYSLLVSANDGTYTTNIYIDVDVTAVDQYFEKLLVVCSSTASKTYVYGISEDGSQDVVFDFNYGYTGSDISSLARQLYITKPSPHTLYAYNLDELEKDFERYAPIPYQEYYDVHAGNRIYVACGSGEIYGYTIMGSTNFVTAIVSDTIPKLVIEHEANVISYCENRSGPGKYLRQYYGGTGVLRISKEIDFSVIDMFGMNQDLIILFGNSEFGAKICVFSLEDNMIIQDIPLGDETLLSATQISEQLFLFSTEQGIYRYEYESNSLASWLAGISPQVIVFDNVRPYVYIADDNMVQMYDLNAGLLQEYTLPYHILNLLVQRNK